VDKLDHAEVRYPSSLSASPAVPDAKNRIEEYVYHIFPSYMLTLFLTSGDNFGTLIRISSPPLTDKRSLKVCKSRKVDCFDYDERSATLTACLQKY
jgi:hypothetical protein